MSTARASERPQGQGSTDPSFVRRTLIVVGIVALVAGAIALLVRLANVLLLIFAGLLFAVWLDGLARVASRWFRLSRPWALTVVAVFLLLLAAALIWLGGPPLVDQVTQMRERIPEAFARLRSDLMQLSWFRALWAEVPPLEEISASGGQVLGVFSTAFGALTSTLLVVVLGVYTVIQPGLYRSGVLALVPKPHRSRADEVLEALGQALRWWFIGRFAAMAVVGVLTAAGLMIVGVPLALALGLLAGLLAFVPFIGPIVSVIPALLIALVESPVQAVWVGVVYGGVQLVESNLITPLIQKRAVRIPPSALLSAQVIFGALFGLLGVFLSTPLAVVAIVLIQMLYVESVLGDRVSVLGQR